MAQYSVNLSLITKQFSHQLEPREKGSGEKAGEKGSVLFYAIFLGRPLFA